MNIKNEEELANIMGMAFKVYANSVERGNIKPYLPFVDGVEAVDVTVFIKNDGSIIVKPLLNVIHAPVNVEVQQAVIEQISVVEAPVLEAQPEEVIEEKPKSRKRKTE